MIKNELFICLFVCLFVLFTYQHNIHIAYCIIPFLESSSCLLCGNSLCLVRWWSRMSCLFVCLFVCFHLPTQHPHCLLHHSLILFCLVSSCVVIAFTLWGVTNRKWIYVSLPVKRIATFIMIYTIYLVAKQQTTMYNRLHIAVECQVYSKYTCVHESVMCGLASSRQCLQNGFKSN